MAEVLTKIVASDIAGIILRIQDKIWNATLAKYKFEKSVFKQTIKKESDNLAFIIQEYRFVLKEKGGRFIKPTLIFKWKSTQKHVSIEAFNPHTNVDILTHSSRDNTKRIVKIQLDKEYIDSEIKILLTVKETDSMKIQNYVAYNIEHLSIDMWNYHVEVKVKNTTDSFIENYLVKIPLRIRSLPEIVAIHFGKEKHMARRAKKKTIERRIRAGLDKMFRSLMVDRATSKAMEILFGGKKSMTLFDMRKSSNSPEPTDPTETTDEEGNLFYSFRLNINPNQSGNYSVYGEKLKGVYDIITNIEEKSKKKHKERERYG